MQKATDAGSAIESYAGPAAGPVPYIAIPSSTNPYPVPSQHRLAVYIKPGFEEMPSALCFKCMLTHVDTSSEMNTF